MIALTNLDQVWPMVQASQELRTCVQVTSARPGVGNSYQGPVRNSDYDFKALIPPNLTAWSGVKRPFMDSHHF